MQKSIRLSYKSCIVFCSRYLTTLWDAALISFSRKEVPIGEKLKVRVSEIEEADIVIEEARNGSFTALNRKRYERKKYKHLDSGSYKQKYEEIGHEKNK